YKKVAEEGYFDGNPEKVRAKWVSVAIVLNAVFLGAAVMFAGNTGNVGPTIFTVIMIVPTLVLSYFMPRRSAKGYAYLRQIEGLKWYLEKGKWRHEISEKKLFLEDVLPLAISLGVVNTLTKDMQALKIIPPNYMGGISTATFARDLGSFNKTLTSNVSSSPHSSGRSTWSGGSGFSSGGGFSGGGFGGGGGGSW
ncbi:DUF2207 family protein, partial [Patescibacteria group bacterium]